jgi:general secretion pathway protein M
MTPSRSGIWWSLRSVREQRMLIVLGALLAATILWLGILRPLDKALADARARHDRAVLALAEAQTQALAIRGLERVRPLALPAPIHVHAGALAGEAGFAQAKIEPEGEDRAHVAIDAARAPALLIWVSDLERRRGLVIERFSARANSDATVAAEFSVRTRGR